MARFILMGLVKHAEADAASDVTNTTRSVQRVVRLFEDPDWMYSAPLF